MLYHMTEAKSKARTRKILRICYMRRCSSENAVYTQSNDKDKKVGSPKSQGIYSEVYIKAVYELFQQLRRTGYREGGDRSEDSIRCRLRRIVWV